MHDLSLYLLELLENSVRAGARHVNVGLVMDEASDELRLTVEDDGQGLKGTPEQTLDPFYTTKAGKKTGLGLSLLKGEAELAGGGLRIGPAPTLGGVLVEVWMRLGSIDRPPLGDVATTLVVMGATNPDTTFLVSLSGDEFQPPLADAPLTEATARLARPADPQRKR